jgi:hypothetical protein
VENVGAHQSKHANQIGHLGHKVSFDKPYRDNQQLSQP